MAKKAAKPVEAQALPTGYTPDLKKVYKEEIVPALMKQFSYTTVMQVPKLVKISVSVRSHLQSPVGPEKHSCRHHCLYLGAVACATFCLAFFVMLLSGPPPVPPSASSCAVPPLCMGFPGVA